MRGGSSLRAALAAAWIAAARLVAVGLVAVGLVAVGLVGCGGVGAGPPPAPRDRFEIAGLDAVRVRAAFERLQAAVASEDRAAIAVAVSFPLRVGGRKVRTPEEMWLAYREIWTPAVQRTVLAQRFDRLFVNVHGVMIGDGVVWLEGVCSPAATDGACENPKVLVTAINPDAAK